MTINKDKISESGVFLSAKEVLGKSPKDLAEYIQNLEADGMLEDFLDEAVKDDQLIAQLSYWEKWFPAGIRKIVDSRIQLERKDMMENEDILPLDLESKYTSEELEYFLASLAAMQLTFGCSKGCKHCGFDATPKVRDEFKYEQLENLYEKYGDKIKRCNMLYYASEPSDYYRYTDVHDLSVKYSGRSPHITTAEADKDWIESLKERTRGGIRLSLDRDSEKFRDASRILAKDKIITFMGRNISMSTPLLEQATPKEQHKPGFGQSYSEKDKTGSGIGCINGALMTPRGIYNVLRQQSNVPSEEHPQGQVVVPIGQISDDPIMEGQNLANILQESLIVQSQFRPDDREADYVMLYRKDGLYDVIFNEDTLEVIKVDKVDNHRLNAPNEKGEQDAYFESEKRIATMNTDDSFSSYSSYTTSFGNTPYKFENIDDDTGKKVIEFLQQNMSKLKYNRIYYDSDDKIPLSAKWQCILTSEDIPELNGPTEVFFHHSFPEQSGRWQINYKFREPQWVARKKEASKLKYFDKMRKRTKEALEDGRFTLADKKGVADYQKLLEYIYNSDLSFLNVSSVNDNEVWFYHNLQFEQGQEEMEFSILIKYNFVKDDVEITIKSK